MRKIITAPQPVLSQQAKEITKIDKTVLRHIEEMKKTLAATRDPEGVGLAAPQVGLSLQLFVTKPTAQAKYGVFINPIIQIQKPTEPHVSKNQQKSASKKGKSTKLEGCLSLPGIWGEVTRHPSVTLRYQDETGKNHTKTFKGFLATIIQHEVDHLNGILFPKHVLEQGHKLYKSHKDKQGQEVFEEIEL